MTCNAVLASLLLFGLVVTGSCYLSDPMAFAETHIANVAVRPLGGMDKPMRIEALLFIAATMSHRSLYILHCAKLLDVSLRAYESTIAQRERGELTTLLESDAGEIDSVLPATAECVGCDEMVCTKVPQGAQFGPCPHNH